MKNKPITLTEATRLIRAAGCTLRVDHGEYRVTVRGEQKATAYRTYSLEDAVAIASAMASVGLS